jgi:transcriptional regulator with XRE-family HTH domain
MDDGAQTTAERIARARRRAGLTQRDLAQRCQRSLSWVQKVETGARGVDRMSVLVMLADALRVELVELTGQPYRHASADLDSGHGAVPALRSALQRATLPSAEPSRESRPLHEIERDLTEVEAFRQAACFNALGERLAEIVEDLTGYSGIGDEETSLAAERLMARAAHVARVTASLLGQHDLATLAIVRETSAASRIGDPVITASADWDVVGVHLHVGDLDQAHGFVLDSIDRLAPHVTTRHGTILLGALNLRAAIVAARSWDRAAAEEYLARARALARDLGDDCDLRQTAFGPRNVELHATEAALELGDPRLAVARAQQLAPLLPQLPSRERRAQGWTVSALSYGLARQDRAALRALEHSASIAREHVSNAPMARALVADLMERERRASGARMMAARMGVV